MISDSESRHLNGLDLVKVAPSDNGIGAVYQHWGPDVWFICNRTIGALDGAISNRADAQIERLASAERDAVLRAFTRLARVSAANEEGTDTRQRVRLKEL